jgi:hypothetical protein
MPLTDSKVRSAKPKEKDYKLSDEKGLFLLVAKTGHKRWRYKYRIDGKEKLLAIGVYPDISLAQAREERDKARSLLANGGDPMMERKAIKTARHEAAANSFEAIAREWLLHRGNKSATGDARLHRILEKDLFPVIGPFPISEITPPHLLLRVLTSLSLG